WRIPYTTTFPRHNLWLLTRGRPIPYTNPPPAATPERAGHEQEDLNTKVAKGAKEMPGAELVTVPVKRPAWRRYQPGIPTGILTPGPRVSP
ncbi:MAG: hypothetical protein AAB403_13765, partial [Planctomycetota bacterium]